MCNCKDMKTLLILYAMHFVGTKYQWGGSNPMTGFDCSGLVNEVLQAFDLKPKQDMSAQSLYNFFLANNYPSDLKEASILFFGKDSKTITHVGIAINNKFMITASGGDSETTSFDKAVEKNAFVKIRPIRKDLVAYISPFKEEL